MQTPTPSQKPDFNNLLKILNREKAQRPVLFEFIINDEICRNFSPKYKNANPDSYEYFLMIIGGFKNLGYDYAPLYAWHTDTLNFPKGEHQQKASRSTNEGGLIYHRKSFEQYSWPDSNNGNYEVYNRIVPDLPDGMKIMACSNSGLLENAIDIVGFENLCMIYLMEPELAKEIFDHIGTRLLDYYRIISAFESVGVCTVNDDWGYKTQTMFPPDMMREFIFPWIKKIIEAIHKNKKPVILHSCGNLKSIMPEIIHDLKIDAKHSFEDNIYCIEDAYEWWHKEIALVGGIDVNFLCNKSPDEVRQRATKLLEQTFDKGGFALGSGNSIPDYVPQENYFAMVQAAKEFSSNFH